jgi:hypothetical protein
MNSSTIEFHNAQLTLALCAVPDFSTGAALLSAGF